MPYIEEIVYAGATIEVTKRFSPRYQGQKVQRGAKKNKTPEDMKKVNQRNAEINLRRLINTNFNPGDLHIVLTYKKGNRPNPELARQQLEKFLRKLRTYFKKQSEVLKYIAVTEYLNKAIHHHLVIPSMDTRDLPELWPHGRPLLSPLDNTRQYEALAVYLIKETSKTFAKEGSIQGKRWCGSKNLEKPKIIKRIISAGAWRKEPKPRKGYYIEKGSEASGISEKTGFQYQFYRMVKIPEKGGGLRS